MRITRHGLSFVFQWAEAGDSVVGCRVAFHEQGSHGSKPFARAFRIQRRSCVTPVCLSIGRLGDRARDTRCERCPAGRGQSRDAGPPRHEDPRAHESHLDRRRPRLPSPDAPLHAHHRGCRGRALRDQSGLRSREGIVDVHANPVRHFGTRRVVGRSHHSTRRERRIREWIRLSIPSDQVHRQLQELQRDDRCGRRDQSEDGLLHDRGRAGRRCAEYSGADLHSRLELHRPVETARMERRMGRPIRSDGRRPADRHQRTTQRGLCAEGDSRSRTCPHGKRPDQQCDDDRPDDLGNHGHGRRTVTAGHRAAECRAHESDAVVDGFGYGPSEGRRIGDRPRDSHVCAVSA